VEINRDKAGGRWELPEALRLTPEKLAEAEAEQRALARTSPSPYANLSPAQSESARAARVIPELEAALKGVEKKLGRVFTAGGAESFGELQEAQKVTWRQLAEAHATLGRFDLAAHYEYDRAECARYLRYWRAVMRDDEHFCPCIPSLTSERDVTFPTHYVKQDVFSVKHGREMHLIACASCRFLNVTHLPPHLAEQRRHRAAARQLAEGLSPSEAARILTARGHTALNLHRRR
jgi:hypothetical protein